MDIIKVPIGYILDWIYQAIGNYGGALILFTLAVKLILLPLSLKQQKSMTKMQKLQPQLTKLQEKYKNDQQLLGQETMKLYKKYGVSPAGGCLPLLIQLPILFALYRVIYQPLTYMCHMGASEIEALVKSVGSTVDVSGLMKEINLAKAGNLINFKFLGLALEQTPSFANWPSLIIPALAGVTTYLSSKITQWLNPNKPEKKEEEKPQRILSPDQKKTQGANNAEGMTKTMSTIMPLFTLWITYTLPMAMGVYWVASNVFSMAQTFLLNGYYARKFSGELEIIEGQRLEKQSKLHGKKKNRRN